MLFDLFKWLLAALSLAGVVLNIKRRRACFFIWSFTNSAWVAVDLYHGVYAQAALMGVYAALAIWGIFAWKQPIVPCVPPLIAAAGLFDSIPENSPP